MSFKSNKISKPAGDKTVIIVLIITLVLLGLLLKSHDWTAPQQSTERSVSEVLPDFSQFKNVKVKKQSFFDYLRPFVRQENQRIRYDRAYLESIEDELSAFENFHQSPHRKLRRLAKRYRVEEKNIDKALELLKRRIDIIPDSFAA